MPTRPLTVALPKGRLLAEVAPLCAAAGLAAAGRLGDERQLLLDDPETGVRLLLARPADVWTYVAYGGADLGITGKDVLVEAAEAAGHAAFLAAGPGASPPPVVELVDLGVGACRMSVAGPAAGADTWPQRRRRAGRIRVGTKYPYSARRYLAGGPADIELIPLAGAVELAPLTGLADVIVDLVATGRTLAANGLVEYERLFDSTARVIANEASLRLRDRELAELVAALERAAARTPRAAAPATPAAGAGGEDR